MRHFFIELPEKNKTTVSLKGSEARHIKNVLRLKAGDTIRLFDGSGFEYLAVITDLTGGRVELSIKQKSSAVTESPVQLIVAQGYLKQKKMDNLIRPLCELGMTRWIPFFSERSVPRPDKNRLADRTRRWQKIARESFKQCRRSILPQIEVPVSFDEMLAHGQFCDLNIIFWEDETRSLKRSAAADTTLPIKRILVVLGPEGGFTGREIDSAKDAGFTVAGLGPRILRAETASLAVCTLMQYIFGDLG
jgi:16S rRNA (uracil1498-N3)-methyltransferase